MTVVALDHAGAAGRTFRCIGLRLVLRLVEIADGLDLRAQVFDVPSIFARLFFGLRVEALAEVVFQAFELIVLP